MKRSNWLILTAGVAAIAFGGAATAQEGNIRVNVNGDPVYFRRAQPRQVDGRVMVPLRGVLERIGANVNWVQSSQTVIATKGGMELNLPIGSRTATVNGREVRLDVPAMTIEGSTMVPLRFVSEALGADVHWSDATQTASIETGPNRGIAAYRDGRRDTIANNDGSNRGGSGVREYRRTSRIALPAGTVLPVRLDDPLTSNENRAGDKFMSTVQSGRDDAGLPAGTRVEGIVREALPSRSGKPGVLDVDFTRVVFPNGDARAIDGGIISLESKGISRSSDGRLTASSGNAGNERLKWVGIGAGAGLLISTLTKGNTLVDTLLGGGAGYLFNELQHKGAGNVNLKAGTEIGVRLRNQFAFNPDRYDGSRQ